MNPLESTFLWDTENSILTLSKRLISIKSNPDNAPELESALSLVKGELGNLTVETFERDWSKSILAYKWEKRPEYFKVILNWHLDVIPWKDFQYEPRVLWDRLYGAWSMDMKSNVSCLIHAFRYAIDKVSYPIWLQIVTDEETWWFNWTGLQVERWVKADFVLAWEPTNFNIANKSKWVCQLRISCIWQTAHGAYPWRWENAIHRMNEFIQRLFSTFPLPSNESWSTTINLAKIETNNDSFNKIPDNCTALFDIRFIPDDWKDLLNKINLMLPKWFEIEVIADEPPLSTNESNSYIQTLKLITEQVTEKPIRIYWAYWTSDARHYTKAWMNWVEFGPIWWWIGEDWEWVDIPSLGKYYTILTNFLLDIDQS